MKQTFRYIHICMLFMALVCQNTVAQNPEDGCYSPMVGGLSYDVSAQASVSDGRTPLWLNANKYGLSSLEKTNGYLRVNVERNLQADSVRRWGLGYGVDVAVPYHYTSKVVVQQAYAELRWLRGTLSVGSKQRPMQLKNNELSSGSQALGINARPVPQARLSLNDYWTLPFANGWLHLKGHLAYGKMTDDNWQHDFTQRQTKYSDGLYYHSKAGYLKIGNDDRFCPWSLELGVEMAAQFGGTSYQVPMGDQLVTVENGNGLKSFVNAFVPHGGEVGEGIYHNAEGNHLGSWMFRLNYDNDEWALSLYGEHFFEDHSSMFQVGKDGYTAGTDNWNQRKKGHFMVYKLKDMMLGAEMRLRWGYWVRHVLFEYLFTKDQCGPVYHDHTYHVSNQIAGNDNYYNHYIYTGWQHWGQVMGNPLYRSPLYNSDGRIEVENNRFRAFHVGVSGNPIEGLHYRLLATLQDGWGSYENPFTEQRHNVSVLAEASWHFTRGKLRDWKVTGSYGMDSGSILGHNQGFQLTISKSGILAK